MIEVTQDIAILRNIGVRIIKFHYHAEYSTLRYIVQDGAVYRITACYLVFFTDVYVWVYCIGSTVI
jgi:hypothetical protein